MSGLFALIQHNYTKRVDTAMDMYRSGVHSSVINRVDSMLETQSERKWTKIYLRGLDSNRIILTEYMNTTRNYKEEVATAVANLHRRFKLIYPNGNLDNCCVTFE